MHFALLRQEQVAALDKANEAVSDKKEGLLKEGQ